MEASAEHPANDQWPNEVTVSGSVMETSEEHP